MKLMKYIAAASIGLMALAACTDLDETLYDQVGTQNYYNTKNDVIRAVFRPFEHAFWSIQSRHVLNELSADQLITPTRDGWWDDGGKWRRLHYHEWNVEDGGDAQTEWNGCFQGIMQCNYVIEDLAKLSPDQFGFSETEFNNLKTQCRALRAWFYLRLLDGFRNIPLAVSFNDVSLNTEKQVEPKVIFKFIEDELKDCLPLLAPKTALGSGANLQGQWTQAGAAALLVRLYLNAGVYVGEDRYSDCATVAEAILRGDYGAYEVASRWDAPFDWNNDECDEVIFGFPASQGYSFWHYQGDTYWWTVPARARYYFGDEKAKGGDHNTKYAASPSYDLDGNLYSYELGMPVENFRKYPGDERMKLYRNLGGSTREGMFLFGYLEYVDENGCALRSSPMTSIYAMPLATSRVWSRTAGLPTRTATCVTATTIQAGISRNILSTATKTPIRWKVTTQKSVCLRSSTRWPSANCVKVRKAMPPNCSTVCAAAIILPRISKRCFTVLKGRPSSMRMRCWPNGGVSSLPKAGAVST